MPTVISDRRAHDRYPIRTEAILRLPDGRQLLCRTLDIGKGGMAVVADINAGMGDTYHVRTKLPVRPGGSALLDARVSVASCVLAGGEGGFRIGLQFFELDRTAKDVLTRFLPQ